MDPLVACLRKFLNYGVPPAGAGAGQPLRLPAPAAGQVFGSPTRGAYRPPQRRSSSLNGERCCALAVFFHSSHPSHGVKTECRNA